GLEHAGRCGGRGGRDARRRLRAVPGTGGAHQAHAARPRRHPARLRASRPGPAGLRGSRCGARGCFAVGAAALLSSLKLADFDYELPEALIAQSPAARREDARMLVVDRATGALHDSRIADLSRWLESGDVLALNETRVRRSRLRLRRASGGAIECLFVRPE